MTEYCPGEPDSWTWPDAYGDDGMGDYEQLAADATRMHGEITRLVESLREIWRRLPDDSPLREIAWAAVEPFGGVPPT